MTVNELLDRHHEAHHPCDVRPASAPDLVVTCCSCGRQMEATMLSPCSGGRADSRAILMLRCPGCASTGQLRFVKEAPWRPVPPEPQGLIAAVEVVGGRQGYLALRCSCGAYGQLYYLGYTLLPGELAISAAVESCGHRVVLTTTRTATFSFEEHRHG